MHAENYKERHAREQRMEQVLRQAVRSRGGARTRKEIKTAASDLSEYDHDKKMLSFVDPLLMLTLCTSLFPMLLRQQETLDLHQECSMI